MVLQHSKRRGLTLIASIGLVSLGLVSCANGGGASAAGSGEGLEYGASLTEWQEAFADVDPIELRTQSSAPKGSASGADWEAFLGSITERSNGKIKIDIGFSNAYAPPVEAADALVDGRLDIAQVIPQYTAEELPIGAALSAAGVLSDYSVLEGTISSNVWPLQAGFDSGLSTEFEDAGMKLLIPYYNTGAGAMFCKEPTHNLEQLSSAVVAASGTKQSEQIMALGASPTTITYTEFYESLERGAVNCAQTTATAGLQVGLAEVAPNIVIDPEAGFIPGSGTIAFSQDAWESLPLVAQQLIWDQTSVFISGNMEKIWGNYKLLSDDVAAANGEILPFDDDAQSVMTNTRGTIAEEIAASAGSEFIDTAEAALSRWKGEVTGAGITNEVGYDGLTDWIADGGTDAVNDFVKGKVFDEIYLPLRPE